MNVIAEVFATQATAEVPVGALIAMGIFVLLIAFFIVAWVRKRKHRLDEEPSERQDETARELHPKPTKSTKPTKSAPPEPVAPPAPEPTPPEEAEKPARPVFKLGEARSLREGLERTHADGFVGRLGQMFRGKHLDEGALEAVEEVMFTSDIGVRTSQRLIKSLRDSLSRKDLMDADAIFERLRDETKSILDRASEAHPLTPTGSDGPRVIMVIGVNGTGKTTSIGKIAARLRTRGERVLLAAGDTFRAAAVEQLEVWARRIEVDVHSGAEGSDPASVVFDAIKYAGKNGYDTVIADTAGRLHTQVNLMKELEKVYRVIGKAQPGAPHEVLLVLDATMGQNAIHQAEIFKDTVDVSGIVLTKLDGTAKGGVVIGICDQLGIPIRWIGVGERVQDLRPFDSDDFVSALYGE